MGLMIDTAVDGFASATYTKPKMPSRPPMRNPDSGLPPFACHTSEEMTPHTSHTTISPMKPVGTMTFTAAQVQESDQGDDDGDRGEDHGAEHQPLHAIAGIGMAPLWAGAAGADRRLSTEILISGQLAGERVCEFTT
jgi:hypothetical protein